MKYILITILALTFLGCNNKELKVKGEECVITVQDNNTTIKCASGTFDFEGEVKDFNLIELEVPNIGPERP